LIAVARDSFLCFPGGKSGKGWNWGEILKGKMKTKGDHNIKINTESFLDIAGVMFIALNSRGEVILINRKGCDILGYGQKEILGKNWFDHFLPKKNRKEVKTVFSKLMAGEIEPNEFAANTVLTKTGEERIIAFHNSALRDDSGRIIGTLSSAEDITEKRKSQQEIIESENFLQSIFEAIQDGISILDTNLTVIRVNRWMEMMYADRESILGRKCYQVYQNRKSVCTWCPSIKTLASGELNSEIVPYPSSKKTRGWIELSAFPLKDVNGQVIGVIEHVKDVTDRKNSEDALRESEEKYRRLIQQSNDAIYLLYNRKFEIVNDKFLKMFDITREEVNNPEFDFMTLVAPSSRVLVEERTKRLKRGENLDPKYEFTSITNDGRTIEVEASVSYVSYKEGIATQGIIRDVSERKRLEEQLRQALKMEAVGRLAGGVAHDFNNLLTVISGYCDMLLFRNLSEGIKNDIEQIRKASERAISLTSQLLAFSRKQLIQPKVLNLNMLIEEHTKMLARLLGEDIEIETALSDDLGLVKIDRGQMEQVMMNIEVNARDAMPKGGKLFIETSNVEFDGHYVKKHLETKPGYYVMLSISDNGMGMDERIISRVFEPFFTTKSRDKGSGLGLATVYGIVKQNNGFVYVYSEPDKGTTFKIYLPRIKQTAKKNRKKLTSNSKLHGHETILLVEDNSSVRTITQTALQNFGYRVLPAGNGKEALDIYKNHSGPVQLLLTDVVMPSMSGKELAEILKALNPRIKVLYYSGYTDNTIAHHDILDPGVDFIQKPFSHTDLARKVREVLDGH
jgi:two-component system cell cycle sensor histidine kinase/response regulator CckA